MNKVMFKGEYMSMETAQEFALLKQENNRLKEKNRHLKELCDVAYTSFEKLLKRVNKTIDLVDKNIMLDEDILKNAKNLGLDEHHIKQISNDLNLYKCLKIELKGGKND